MKDFIEISIEKTDVDNYIDSVFQEANEASKKLRRTLDQFLNDNYTEKDLKNMTAKQRNRIKKFLKDSDYDPKTGTIDSDIVDKNGKPVRINFTTKGLGGASPDEPALMMAPERRKEDTLKTFKQLGLLDDDSKKYVDDAFKDDKPSIHMNKEWLKRHPGIAQGLRKHEEGHIDKWLHTKADDYDHSHTGKVERTARKLINHTNRYLDDHDKDPEENWADLYSVKHNKYQKHAMRMFNVLNSKEKLIRNKLRKQINGSPRLTSYVDNIEDLKDLLDSTVETLGDFVKAGKGNSKMLDAARQQYEIYKKCLNDIDKLDYENAARVTNETQKRIMKITLEDIYKKLDEGAVIRKQFVQNMIKESYVDIDDIMDVIQEMCDPWDTIQSIIDEDMFQESAVDEYLI